MNKKLIYTALGLIGIMGALSIGVVSAAETRVIPGEHENITYILNGDEEHSFNAGTLTVTDCEDVDNPTDDCTIITILDRNLGATVAGTGCDYTTNGGYCPYDNTYGYHFQWGNNYGFKPGCDLSGSTYYCSDTITSNAVNGQVDATTISYNPNNQEYYYSGVFHYGNPNWLNDNSKIDLWGGSTDDTTTFVALTTGQAELRRGPCPEGFHVPSIGELTKLSSMFTGGLDMHNQLKIPFAGLRYATNASVYDLGYYAILWSSSPYSASDPYSRNLGLLVDGGLGRSSSGRAHGLSVRCFYDFYQPYTEPLTLVQLTFAASDDNGSTSASTGAVESGSVVQLSTGDYVATKDGWTHLGWNTDPSATEALDSITLTGDTTVYAIFSKNLTVNYDKGTGVSEISKTSDNCTVYNTGTSCTLTSPTITVSEGYENGVWTKGDDTLNPGEDVTLTSDGDTYTAIATAKEYAITFVDESGENGPEVHSGAYLSDISNITFPSWTRDRYIISWDKEIPATMPLNGDTITASWTQNPAPSGNGGGYSGGGGSRNSSDSKGTENNPSVTDVTAPLESGAQGDNDGSSLSRGDAASAERGGTQNYSDEFQKAYEFAYKNGITTMDSIEKANMGGKLTRIAMAKMLSYYAINVLGQKPDETRNNKFNDITEKLDTEYDNGVTLAYQLGIMGINMPNNEFRPNDLVTRAEFATALSRMLYSTPDGNPYYVPHIEKLKSEGILTNDDYKMKELRGYVMIMLMRSAK